ncbi:FUSC family membrane protein [Spirosoma soli]|uniref:FUSC family membrane protein n=1 Tax=Spirosoma soli TaxID=1770529 RepID=A0ABW5LXM9_9BACT
MNKRTRQVSYFLSSQYFSDGLRITLSILLPSLLLAQADQLATGMAMSLGALSVSLSDAPGPTAHRRNGMAATVLAGFLVTLVTGFARMNIYTLGLEILLFGFFFSMLGVYGNRATSVGTAALLVMILMIDRPLDAAGILRESALILAGGVWYTAISMLSSRLQPYRPAQQALGQCIHEIAKFMAIKADFYTISTRLDDDYRRLLTQQVTVSEKQDAVREILFKSRRFVTESTRTGRLLVLTFVDVVDLYEQIVAMYYDYSAIREQFGQTGVLDTIASLIRQLSVELDHIGLAIQSPVPIRRTIDYSQSLEDLKRTIDELGDQEGNTLVLKKVLVSLRNLTQRLAGIQQNITSPTVGPIRDDLEYGRFVSHQEIDGKSILDNLTLSSSVYRHSIRVAVAMLLGFVLTKLLEYGHHSYWVILTISVILKPAFSLTKQRNTERIIGTLVGGLMGVLVLTLIPSKTIHFVFMVFFMLGTYTALRVNYIIMVVCVTPFVLILFTFLGVSYLGVAEERFLDTLLGGVIALATSYLLFPNWESDQLATPMRALLQANVRYLQLLYDSLLGKPINVVDYKLARKDVYVTSANLSAAFDRMVSEPKHKQRHERIIYEFVVLNHILSANIATLTSALVASEPKIHPAQLLRPAKRALFVLTESLRRLGMDTAKSSAEAPAIEAVSGNTPDDPLLAEQLNFIQQVSSDISKLVEKVKPKIT